MVVVEVRTLMGAAETVEVDAEWTPLELRKAVCTKLGVQPDLVDLISRGNNIDDTPEAMEAVKRGSAVRVVPRAKTGFSMRKDGAGPSVPGIELRSQADIVAFLQSLQGVSPEALGDAAVSVMVEGSDGEVTQQKIPLADLAGALEQLQTQLAATPKPAQPGGEASGALGAFGASEPAETGSVNPEVQRRERQRIHDMGVEIFKERERKKGEASRISSKLDDLREKRAAKAAKRRRLAERRQRRARGSIVDDDEPHRTHSTSRVPAVGFGGLKKGFLM
eukprot:m.457506 g.457506  ORF g.457506 m.457506 type:complete len:278 (+) comp21276_c0_seq1:145-978(+)